MFGGESDAEAESEPATPGVSERDKKRPMSNFLASFPMNSSEYTQTFQNAFVYTQFLVGYTQMKHRSAYTQPHICIHKVRFVYMYIKSLAVYTQMKHRVVCTHPICVYPTSHLHTQSSFVYGNFLVVCLSFVAWSSEIEIAAWKTVLKLLFTRFIVWFVFHGEAARHMAT